jgi:NAD(P)-dependent dehydrogenase (short-subunit alcohol dehydrogenase family)
VLDGRIALVAGATRGAGRGIAVELGAAGATVYVTGRSSRGRPSAMDRPETIEETARFIGRAVVALAAYPRIHARTASLLATWDLAHEYDFDDVDGRRPDWGAYAATLSGPASGEGAPGAAPGAGGEDPR